MKPRYVLFIRSILEPNYVVWHTRLTEENNNDLVRIQKSACKILKNKNLEYETTLQLLHLDTPDERREI